MELAGTYDFTIQQYAYFERTLTYYNPDGVTPIDLTGYTAKMHVRKHKSDTTKILDLTTENGGLLIDATDGKVTIVITDEKTAELEFDTAFYDIKLIPTNGKDKRWIEGTITLSKGTTK